MSVRSGTVSHFLFQILRSPSQTRQLSGASLRDPNLVDQFKVGAGRGVDRPVPIFVADVRHPVVSLARGGCRVEAGCHRVGVFHWRVCVSLLYAVDPGELDRPDAPGLRVLLAVHHMPVHCFLDGGGVVGLM